MNRDRIDGNELDRTDRSADRPTARSDHTTVDRRERTSTLSGSRSGQAGTSPSEWEPTDSRTAPPERSVTAEADVVTATLVGLPRVDLREFVYAHRLDCGHRSGERRPLALFDVTNTGDRPLRWKPSRTRFVGDDDYMYRQARISLDPSQLGPGCHTRRVVVEPGRRARVATMVERLPTGVEVAEVVHTVVPAGNFDTRRLAFPVQ